MGLDDLWFALFVLIIAGYLVLDGFDLGVGMLHVPLAKDDTERRIALNSIGPIWDGNEVWLVLGGGVLFAAFPVVYAALLSGFYWAIMLLLLVLILRTVSIEFRGERESPGWRRTWDWVFCLSSFFIAMIIGIAFGNVVRGVPVNGSGDVDFDSFTDLFHPFALWLGLTTVAMLSLHGALYLDLKTDGPLQERVRRSVPLLTFFFVATGVVAALWGLNQNSGLLDVYEKDVWPLVFPLGALASFAAGVYWFRAGRDGRAFVCSSLLIVLLLCTVSAGLYPNLLISSTDESNSLTLSNAAAQDNTLTVMLIVALIGMPFVLLYLAGVNYFFRGKVRLTSDSY
jgi:cytochrome d ubiquinol oxidase subunit II